MMSFRLYRTLCIALAVAVAVGTAPAFAELKGKVKVDGSSTVAPVTMAAAELFQEEHSGVRVTVGISGTGGGFKKFLDPKPDLRTDINDASRPITKSELDLARKVGVEFIEIPVAIDGLAVIVHPSNAFADHLTVAELKRIWEPGSTINNWKDVRAGFPDLPIKLFGPGNDSGTFDYFTEAICGKEKASRSDYAASENDNVLVQGVASDRGSLGYFGFSYYEANKGKLKLVGIDNGSGKPVKPSLEVIRAGEYRPLARPLFLYVNKEAATRPEVKAFVGYILDNARMIVEHPRVNYVMLPEALYAAGQKRLDSLTTGSPMADAENNRDLAKVYGAR